MNGQQQKETVMKYAGQFVLNLKDAQEEAILCFLAGKYIWLHFYAYQIWKIFSIPVIAFTICLKTMGGPNLLH